MVAACGSDAQPAAEPAASTASAASTPTTPPAASTTATAAPTTAAPTTTPPPPKPTSPPRQATAKQLRSALLTQRDLPAGFTLGRDPEADPGQNPTYRSSSPACAKAVNALYNELPAVRAGVRYTHEYTTGRRQLRTVLEELGSWPGNGAAHEMDAVAKTPARCPTWNYFDSQYGVVPTTATPQTISKIGEQVIAYMFTTHWNGRGDTHDIIIFARSDTRQLSFEYTVPVGREIDWAECYKILGAALRKLPAWRR
jgi:hypothetical protein